jgi:transposase
MTFNQVMAYSLDLRQRIMAAVERGTETKRDIAKTFGVHESFIYKLVRQQRELGHIAPLPHGGGASPKLTESEFSILTDLVAETSDATLDELRRQMKREARVAVSTSTICRALQTLGLTLKKRPSVPTKPIPGNAPRSASAKKSYRSNR